MKTDLYKQAKTALKNSLKNGLLDEALVKEQIERLKETKTSQRLALLRLYARLLRHRLSEEVLIVTTSFEVEEPLRSEIANSLQEKFDKKLRLSFEIDPAILGGIKVQKQDTIYDFSIYGKLAQLREAFS